MLPKFKIGNCQIDGCNAVNTRCRKIGKQLICIRHYQSMKTQEYIQRADKRHALKSEQLKTQAKLRNDTYENKLVDNQAKENFEKLQVWFEQRARELAKHPYCAECGAYIPEKYYRHATAHVLPKSPTSGFPSVATHEENYLFLGAGCGCHNKTDRWDKFSQMKVWGLAIEKIKKMYPSIHPSERRRLPDVVMQEIEPD